MRKLGLLLVLTAATAAWTTREVTAPRAADRERPPPIAERADAAFELEGILVLRQGDKVTIRRDRQPPATLTLTANTQVFVDGKKAQPERLRDGVHLRASFQLDGERPLALRLDASSAPAEGPGTGGSGLDEEFKSELDRMREGPVENTPGPPPELDEGQMRPAEAPREAW